MPRIRVLWLLLAIAGCGGGGSTAPFEQPTPPPPPPGGLPPGQGNVAMASSNDGYGTETNAFNPGTVTIARAGSVSWTNNTGILHNVTFNPATGAPSNIGSFATGTMSRSFSTAGTFSYQCSNHAGMTGQVIVQ